VRRGVDAIKAVALGAEGVMLGARRCSAPSPPARRGARRAIEILRDELVRSMQLSGVRSIREIAPDLPLHRCNSKGRCMTSADRRLVLKGRR